MITIDDIPVFNATIADDECGMLRVSLVDYPAVESDFQRFASERKRTKQMYAVANEEKRLVRGVLMRADYPIYRCDSREYYIIYKAETIRQMAEKYLKEGRANDVNLMHSGADVEGVNLVQYFIKGDGVQIDGFEDIADGSLFAEYHITNDEIWKAVKEGTYKGFSLEGVFGLEAEEDDAYVDEVIDKWGNFFARIFKNKEKNMNRLTKLATSLAKMLAKFASIPTDKGILTWDGEEDLKVGDAVFIEAEDGTRLPAEDGEYIDTDSRTIIIAEGKVASIAEKSAEEVVEDAPVAEEEVVEEVKAEEEVEVVEDPATEDVVEAPVAEETNEAIDALDLRINELESRIADLESRLAEVVAVLERVLAEPIAEPAHEEYKKVEKGVVSEPRAVKLARLLNK